MVMPRFHDWYAPAARLVAAGVAAAAPAEERRAAGRKPGQRRPTRGPPGRRTGALAFIVHHGTQSGTSWFVSVGISGSWERVECTPGMVRLHILPGGPTVQTTGLVLRGPWHSWKPPFGAAEALTDALSPLARTQSTAHGRWHGRRPAESGRRRGAVRVSRDGRA